MTEKCWRLGRQCDFSCTVNRQLTQTLLETKGRYVHLQIVTITANSTQHSGSKDCFLRSCIFVMFAAMGLVWGKEEAALGSLWILGYSAVVLQVASRWSLNTIWFVLPHSHSSVCPDGICFMLKPDKTHLQWFDFLLLGTKSVIGELNLQSVGCCLANLTSHTHCVYVFSLIL